MGNPGTREAVGRRKWPWKAESGHCRLKAVALGSAADRSASVLARPVTPGASARPQRLPPQHLERAPDRVHRARDHHGPRGPPPRERAPPRPRSPPRRAGGTRAGRRPPPRTASQRRSGGAEGGCVSTARSARAKSGGSMLRQSLSPSTPTRATSGRGRSRRSIVSTREWMPAVLWATSKSQVRLVDPLDLVPTRGAPRPRCPRRTASACGREVGSGRCSRTSTARAAFAAWCRPTSGVRTRSSPQRRVARVNAVWSRATSRSRTSCGIHGGEGRAALGGDAREDRPELRVRLRGHERHARLHDARLLTGDLPEGVAEVVGVVHRHVGHGGHQRREHVRGVQAPAEPHLDDRDVHARSREGVEAEHRHRLEEGEAEVDDDVADLLGSLEQRRLGRAGARPRRCARGRSTGVAT